MQTTTRARMGLVLGALIVLGTALATADTTDNYILGPGDKIAILVFGHEELSMEGVTVRPDGLVTHPFLGALKASGQTPTQLAARITEDLKKELREPIVTISVLEMTGASVYVRGEVTAPGAFPATAPLPVARALNLALGLTPRANRREAYIINPQGDSRKVDLAAALGERMNDFMLQPRETLVVPPVQVKAVTIIGEVGKPGKYGVAAPDDTVMDALLECGGVTPNADRRYALLVRGGDQPQRVDIGPILTYQAGFTGPRLETGDMLVFPRAVNYVTVWGAVAKPGRISLGPDEVRVADVVAGSGGFTPSADTDTGSLIHATGESEVVNLKAAMETPTTDANRVLEAGDTVLVATRRNEVTLIGAVGRPGPQPFLEGAKLLNVLTDGGGLLPTGDKDNVTLLRSGEKPAVVSVRAMLKDGDLTNNLALRVGDTVVVPEVKREVFVFGAVGTPGKFQFEEDDRMMDVLARVGVAQSGAASWQIALIRKRGVDVDIYLVDFDKLIRGKTPDKNYLIQNGDVIVVPKTKGTNWREWVQQLFSLYGLISIFR